MDDHERQEIVDRACWRESERQRPSVRPILAAAWKRFNHAGPGAVDSVPGDTSVNSVPFSMRGSTVS
jgi:hypothetical protein